MLSPEELLARKQPLIITSRFYHEIKPELVRRGLREDTDFTYEQKFEEAFRWSSEGRIVCRELDLSVTPRCTLQCWDCNMQMRRFSEKRDFPIRETMREVDRYFRWVDYVQFVGILGGEPFLHPRLNELLAYISEHYRGRMTYLEVLTNGTVMPDALFWELCAQHNISIQLSDYSAVNGNRIFSHSAHRKFSHLAGVWGCSPQQGKVLEKEQILNQKVTEFSMSI